MILATSLWGALCSIALLPNAHIYQILPNTCQMFYQNSCCKTIDLTFNLRRWRDSCIVMIYFIIRRSTVSTVFVFCLFVVHLVIPTTNYLFHWLLLLLTQVATSISQVFATSCTCQENVNVTMIIVELSSSLSLSHWFSLNYHWMICKLSTRSSAPPANHSLMKISLSHWFANYILLIYAIYRWRFSFSSYFQIGFLHCVRFTDCREPRTAWYFLMQYQPHIAHGLFA